MVTRVAGCILLAFVVLLAACVNRVVRPYPPPEGGKTPDVVGVVVQDAEGLLRRVEFNPLRHATLTDTGLVIAGALTQASLEPGRAYLSQEARRTYRSQEGGAFFFPSDRIQGLLVREFSPGKTVAAVVLIPAGIVLFVGVAALSSSCPILYAFDGETYHPDAEPLGGATTLGLARRDLSRLERIRPFEGRYRLAAVNEMDETQYVDALSLVVVDHPEGTEVYGDREGGLHLISNPVAPRSAMVQDGRDVRSLLLSVDGDAFSYSMEESLGKEGIPARDSLILEFERPVGATKGELVMRASTTPWGGVMLRQMLELWGSEVDEWYHLLDESAAARAAQEAWALREEHWVLKVWVEGRAGWEARDAVVGSGPLVAETQVVTLDLSQLDGDLIRVRVDPPRGFWTLDYAAMDFSGDEDFLVHRIQAIAARDEEGGDLLPALLDEDSAQVEMPDVGDRVSMEFPVPQLDSDYPSRSVFATTKGYYRIHTDRMGERQTSILDRLWLEPDYGVGFSFRTFADWRAGKALEAPGVLPLRIGR
jgi:hypothetical protein